LLVVGSNDAQIDRKGSDSTEPRNSASAYFGCRVKQVFARQLDLTNEGDSANLEWLKKTPRLMGNEERGVIELAMKVSESNDKNQPRKIRDAPFCWQHKETLHMIRDVFENGHGIAAIPISVYVALTELASDAQSETFTASINEIRRRAGVSYRSAFEFLKRFEAINLIAVGRRVIEKTKERLPSTYTLMSPYAHRAQPLCKHFSKRLPRLKKNRKESLRISTPQRAVSGLPLRECDSELAEYLPEEREVIDLYHELLCDTDASWKRVNKYTQEVSNALLEAGENVEQLIRLAATGDSRVAIPKQRTLVRLIWENWQNEEINP
jgi:hypothetical protein